MHESDNDYTIKEVGVIHRILIADDDKNFTEILDKKISEDSDFEVIAKLYDGENTIEHIERLRPDIILLDIIMPGSDGVYIVDYIRRRIDNYSPIIYIMSGISTNGIIKALNQLDVDFFSMKPVSIEIIMQNLNAIIKKRAYGHEIGAYDMVASHTRGGSAREEVADRVKALTLQLGVPPHHKSARCMNDALVYCMAHPDGTHLITKVLYPEIAKKNGITTSAVERNIRHAIGVVQKTKTPVYNRIFSYAGSKRVTNAEFLSVVIEYLSMRLS